MIGRSGFGALRGGLASSMWVKARSYAGWAIWPAVQSCSTSGAVVGATTIQAAQMAAAAIGVDASMEMLAVGRQRASAAGAANVASVAMADDAARHRFAAETFDAVVGHFGVMSFCSVPGFGHALPGGAEPDAKSMCDRRCHRGARRLLSLGGVPSLEPVGGLSAARRR